MAGGGVGEAMLIGAAVGAGTGGIMSAAQDKDVGQGMLLGALGGAATGGIGSGIGGAAGSAIESAATPTLEAGLTNAGTTAATQELGGAALNQVSTAAADQAAQQVGQQTLQQTAQTGASDLAQVVGSRQGDIVNGVQTAANPTSSGTGIVKGLTTAQQIGAGTTGGISGLMAANSQPAPYQAPGQEQYNGPLSKFKMAGPSLSQYSYDPNSFKPSVAPGFAEGGITDLDIGKAEGYARNAIDPVMMYSRGGIASFADGGGINFIHNLQPGGEFGDMTADIYGAVQEHKPKWLQDIEPGGFIGATVPGKLDWEEKKRKEEEEKLAQDRAAKEAKAAAMYNQLAQGSNAHMARGGIADLGSYSDGGRLLRGPGDGMSDNIPASIGGKQPARLADGEFVVPADVVSHLGNGSTDAGAKTLYSMMDKVRKARTGNKKQGREINPNKYVPGMAQGGEVKRYAQGNLVVNDQGQVGYYKQNGDNPWDREWVPATYGSADSTLGTPATTSPAYSPSVYTPETYNYSDYTKANRPSGNAPQYYGDIYRGSMPDFSTPGYTLSGGNLGRWNNVAGEEARAAQPASMNQQVTQAYLRNLGRAPETSGLNYWMNSGLTGPQLNQAISQSEEGRRMAPGAVNDYFNRYLGRDAQPSGIDYWSNQMVNSGAAGVQSGIRNSPEGQVRRAFQDYLGRTPEGAGSQYWQQQMAQGMSGNEMRNQIATSPEAQVKNAFQDYLGRAPRAEGLQYWTGQMANGMTGDEMRNLVRSSEEGANRNAWRDAPVSRAEEPKEEKKRKGGIAALARR